jgi:phage terminase large subunit|tara:strand:+ start:969 stop:2270 length:1302 start_codon:yes stop_codon:yes gene_type:complete
MNLSPEIIDKRLRVPRAPVFNPFLKHSRYKAAFGGRGSGKSHDRGSALILWAYKEPIRFVCIREIQKDLKQSVKQLLEDKIRAFGLGTYFDVVQNEIRGANGSLIIFKGMNDYNADSIKSLENYDGAWVEEAHTFSQRSLDLLRPTFRKESSEIWFTWNPTDEFDAVDKFIRGPSPPLDSIVVDVDYTRNPWFPDVLRKEMAEDRNRDPVKAAHVWDGEYMSAPEGAYFAAIMADLNHKARIGIVPHDPNLEVHVSWDLGNGPNMVAWFSQWVNREILIIDHLEGDEEARNEGWPWYVRKLREKKYLYAPLILPHDARPAQRVTGKGDEQALRDFGFETVIVPRMDKGEAVKLSQRVLPICRFDSERCKQGIKALKHYQPNYDEKMRIDRGPKPNWASHHADAFRHLAQRYETPKELAAKRPRNRPSQGAWMR